jgi:penicillin-binding protein 1A
VLVVLAFFGAGLTYEVVKLIYGGKAEKFDLSEMEKMEAASVVFDRKGEEIGKIFIQNRNPVPYEKISPLMVKAVIAAEDNDFYKHDGVDYRGIMRAAVSNWRKGHIAQGASTVTQQLARNSFDSPDIKERTYKRKLTEIFLAQRIEKQFSKDKIMEMYLNRVYFGGGLYGVESAARGYFGKSAAELTAPQCAMLAGLLKSPVGLSPWNNIKGATDARNFVLKRMNDLGFISRDDYKLFSSDKLYVLRRTNPYKSSYAMDYIRQQAIASLGYERAMNGGFRITSTLDANLQKMSERALKDRLLQVEGVPGYPHETYTAYQNRVKTTLDAINAGNLSLKLPEPKYLQGAVLALDNATGGILSMVGGRDIHHSEYNRVLQARTPSGTAFTPFVFAAAYEKGIFPGEVLQDACFDNRFVMVGGETGILGEWGVERLDNDYEGSLTTRDVLARGKNAATVRLGLQVGVPAVSELAKKVGIRSPLNKFSNTFLGSSELTLEELTLAYTTFPDHGLRPKHPHIIQKIVDSTGSEIFRAKPDLVPAMSPAAAYQVHMGLVDALKTGTGAAAYTDYGLENFPAAGKTGTSYGFKNAFFIGYTNAVTCGVWVGFDAPKTIYRGAFGRDLAMPVWTRIMNASVKDFPVTEISKPDTLKEVKICKESGLLATSKCVYDGSEPGHKAGEDATYIEYATAEQMPQIPCDIHGQGIRDYTKTYETDENAKRAVSAIDLATIRPIAVSAPTLLGLNDVYNSVKPAAQRLDGDIPVQRAIPVDGVDPQAAAENAAAADPNAPIPVPSVAALPAEPEVRRAEPAKPNDSPLDGQTIPVPVPAPINF